MPVADRELDYDPATVKVLHMVRRAEAAPGQSPLPALHSGNAQLAQDGDHPLLVKSDEAKTPSQSAPVLPEAPGAEAQALKQLQRFKLCMKKNMADVWEGITDLFGWKIKLRMVGKDTRWHLTWPHQEDVLLIFQLRYSRTGEATQFEIMDTPWAQQLQSDWQVMSWLQAYDSIPGFLAEVTLKLLAEKTLG